LPTPENGSIDVQLSEAPQGPVAPAAVSPAWHTLVLAAGIIAVSVHGASRFSVMHGPLNRLATYGFTAAMETAMLAWVALGMRLKKIPLRSLLGAFSFSFRSISLDLCIAAAFWFASLMVLGTLSLAWSGAETALTYKPAPTHPAGQSGKAGQTGQPGKSLATDPARQQALRALAELAPANSMEIAAWTLLCLLVGFVEEIIFRGYLQRQFISWARGGVGVGVLASAAVFGGAHAYQGVRAMVLLAVYGALFSVLAINRRSLRAGMFAHGWHDLIAGLTLAFLRSNHVI
jgi:hypothetical protein